MRYDGWDVVVVNYIYTRLLHYIKDCCNLTISSSASYYRTFPDGNCVFCVYVPSMSIGYAWGA